MVQSAVIQKRIYLPMPQLLKRIFVILFLGLCCALNAQKIRPKQNSVSKSSALELQEKRVVADAFNSLNKNEDKKAYKTAHHLLKTSKIKANTDDINLLLAYYFDKRSLIDSSLFYTNQALKYNTSSNDSLRNRMSSLCYNLLAINNKKRGLLEESKRWYIKG